FEAGVVADGLIATDEVGGRAAFFGGNGDGDDFGVEAAFAPGGGGFAVRVERVGVLLAARDVVFGCDVFAGDAHMVVVVDVPKAIVNHGIDCCGVAEAEALAGLGQEVGRVAHGFHASGDYDVRVVGLD